MAMNQPTPFHLQGDDNAAVILPAEEDDPTVPQNESREDSLKRKEEEKKAGIRRVKVGKVDLHPDLGESSAPHMWYNCFT
jgi:hypothetical protein